LPAGVYTGRPAPDFRLDRGAAMSAISPEIRAIVDGLKIVRGLMALEKAKPDPQRSRPVVYAAAETAEVLLRRLEHARRR
jgi:hypothetical protein